MGKFGINERHSSIELNWHLPLIDQEALELKRFLVRELDQQDISTHGLTFTIKTHREMFYFTSVVIEKCLDPVVSAGDRYTILFARSFDPNNFEYLPYARNVKKEIIPALLIELSKLYFRQLHREKDKSGEQPGDERLNGSSNSYQCSNCLTIYDKQFGDPESGIPPGVPFEKLPDDYKCHVCDSPKKYFIAFRDQ
jgi:rubredoxin